MKMKKIFITVMIFLAGTVIFTDMATADSMQTIVASKSGEYFEAKIFGNYSIVLSPDNTSGGISFGGQFIYNLNDMTGVGLEIGLLKISDIANSITLSDVSINAIPIILIGQINFKSDRISSYIQAGAGVFLVSSSSSLIQSERDAGFMGAAGMILPMGDAVSIGIEAKLYVIKMTSHTCVIASPGVALSFAF